MARKSVPAVSEQTTDAGTTQPAETEPVSDEELLARIQQEFANRPEPQAPKRASLMDLYHESVSLVAGALGYRLPKLRSEAHAVKLWELTMMWALNTRTDPSASIIPTEEIGPGVTGEEDEEPVEAPEPNEVIEASEDQSDPIEA